MTMRSGSKVGAVAAALVIVVVAGCSSDGGTEGATTSEVTTPATASPDTTTPSTMTAPVAAELTLTSSAFADGASIPATYACPAAGGDGDSPPLSWSGVPADVGSLIVVVHDPDAPIEGGFTHLVTVLGDIDSVPAAANRSGGPMNSWIPMCPPSGEHHYEFTLYAFGADVTVPAAPDKAAIDALAPQALATATLTGLFAAP